MAGMTIMPLMPVDTALCSRAYSVSAESSLQQTRKSTLWVRENSTMLEKALG